MGLVLEISDDVEQALLLPESSRKQVLLLELAVALYARGLLPLGKAGKLASLGRVEFGHLLGQRGIPRGYDSSDLSDDLGYARGD